MSEPNAAIVSTSSNTVEEVIRDEGGRQLAEGTSASPVPRVLIPSNAAEVLVGQTKRTAYYDPGDQALYPILEPFLQSVEWVLVFSRSNFTTSSEQHVVRTLTRLSVTNGTEASKSLDIAGSFKGLTVGFGASSKTFTTTETTEEREYTATYTIPPGESLFVYQRRYTFNERIWWILDAWGQLWTVGRDVTYRPIITANILLHIHSDELLSSNVVLTGQESVYVKPATATEREGNQTYRQFVNITKKAKKSINSVLESANHTRNAE
ncbi:hypothetical protein OPQ81_011231 [Rhizoctonia solani]|nr:hypothetical protein OPQ81_002692 [Rhizoctonia solani]KAJ1303030.1 hypothetical protein OPQ81_011231 [Rhizoctonia solani]